MIELCYWASACVAIPLRLLLLLVALVLVVLVALLVLTRLLAQVQRALPIPQAETKSKRYVREGGSQASVLVPVALVLDLVIVQASGRGMRRRDGRLMWSGR